METNAKHKEAGPPWINGLACIFAAVTAWRHVCRHKKTARLQAGIQSRNPLMATNYLMWNAIYLVEVGTFAETAMYYHRQQEVWKNSTVIETSAPNMLSEEHKLYLGKPCSAIVVSLCIHICFDTHVRVHNIYIYIFKIDACIHMHTIMQMMPHKRSPKAIYLNVGCPGFPHDTKDDALNTCWVSSWTAWGTHYLEASQACCGCSRVSKIVVNSWWMDQWWMIK